MKTFQEWIWHEKNINKFIDELTDKEYSNLYKEYLNSEYYNGEKGD